MQRMASRRARRGLAPRIAAIASAAMAAPFSAAPCLAATDEAIDGARHAAAVEHVPFFITPPGQTDVLMVAMALLLVAAVLGVGVLFLRIHTLPERMAHKSQKLQFEIVAVLGLLALFTHIHLFWVAGLLLALIELPDFSTPLSRMARALERLAGIRTVDPEQEAARPSAEIMPSQEATPDASEPAPQRPATRPRLAEGA